MKISVRARIYGSFLVLVAMFVVNALIAIVTLNRMKESSAYISTVVDPSVHSLISFRKMMLESRSYTTNWVYLRYREEDKELLKKIHDKEYPALKSKINSYTSGWRNKSWVDSLNNVYAGFEELLVIEKSIMNNLKEFTDYDDPVIKLEAERKIEEEILPRSAKLLNSLSVIYNRGVMISVEANRKEEALLKTLRSIIIVLAVTIICLGLFLSLYMTRKILRPINTIRHIVNDLGKGITKKISHKVANDEIGEMVGSVNNLSDKLHRIADFATEIGNRNFSSAFEPLSARDTLGKALVAMRDNLKKSDEKLNKSQHIAKLGSWECDLETGKTFWSDEMCNILGVNLTEFTPQPGDYFSFVHADDREYAKSFVPKCLKDHQPYSYECRITCAKKHTKILYIQGALSKNDNGKLMRLSGVIQDITERKNTQLELERVNRELNILFNSIDEIFFSVDMINSKVIQISASCERIYGYAPSEFLANHMLWFSIVHPDDKHIIDGEEEIIKRGEPIHNQYRIISKDKKIRWVETKLTSTLNKDGILTRVDGITRDVTERKNAEDVLKESEDQLAIATKIAKLGYWEFDVIKNQFTFNDQFYALLKTTADEAGGCIMAPDHYVKRFVHPEDVSLISTESRKALKSAELHYSCQLEHRIIYATGKIGHVSSHFYTVKNKSNRTIKVIGVNQDITERKNAEAELQRSKEQYRQIVETAQEGIWMIDENNITTFINKKMCDIVQYSPEEVMGKQIHLFMNEDANKDAAQQIERRKQGISETHDSIFITKSGTPVWTSISTNPVFDSDGIYKGALAMVTDITKRKHDEELIQKSQANLALNNQQLEQKNKELEQFAYVASHDLQEPLRTTTSFVKIFKQQYYGKLDANADKYLNYITQASDRMRVLIKDLLDFSRIGNNKDLEHVDCNIILQDVTADLNKAITDAGAEIKAGKLPVINGYTTELKQLFQNLIINSIKFRKKRPPKISIAALRINDHWRFAFTDNGIGIDKLHRDRIFIIFQRLHTRAEYQGSGIGLSHCKKIVELHHGKIWVESEPNEGSTFYFTIHSPKEKL